MRNKVQSVWRFYVLSEAFVTFLHIPKKSNVRKVWVWGEVLGAMHEGAGRVSPPHTQHIHSSAVTQSNPFGPSPLEDVGAISVDDVSIVLVLVDWGCYPIWSSLGCSLQPAR